MSTFSVETFDVKKYDKILARGLSKGMGNREDTMCIEAAICTVLNLPHNDDPKCVTSSVRLFKITLNDKNWSSPKARARGLRDLGLAQLGSLGVVNARDFSTTLVRKTISILLPTLVRELYPCNEKFLALAKKCEETGNRQSALNLSSAAANAATAADADSAAYAAANSAAYAAANAATAAYAAANSAAYAAATAAANAAYAAAAANAAAYAAANAASAAAYAAANAADAAAYAAANAASAAADAASAAYAAASAADANSAAYAAASAANRDKYLKLSAQLALETLRELNSPGIALLNER